MGREVLIIADSLAREKNIDKDVVFSALELALASAIQKNYEDKINIRVEVNKDNGEFKAFKRWLIIEDVEDCDSRYQIKLSFAKYRVDEPSIGNYIEEEIEGDVDFGRIGIKSAQKIIINKLREAEKNKIISEYTDTNYNIVYGTVVRMDKGNAIIECGKIDAILRREHMIPKENIRVGDFVRGYLHNIEDSFRGPQIELSRTCPEFLIGLFKIEAPEINDGLLDIKAAVRDPGLRSKIAVHALDSRIDPIGACIGIRGNRIQSISNELAGERIDVVIWSNDIVQFSINALAPAKVENLFVDEDNKLIEASISGEELPLSIGSKGQNIRLIRELIGWNVNLISVEEQSAKRDREVSNSIEYFIKNLDISNEIAMSLVEDGYTNIEEIAYIPLEEMLSIESFTEEIVEDLRKRALQYISYRELMVNNKIKEVPEDILNLLQGVLSADAIVEMYEGGIRSLDDLADLSADELLERVDIDSKLAGEIIMKARSHWFE